MAAGLGFKTFTTGEVLTAADTNGYLMQGINVFASSAARSAAITSPQEGQYSYLKDTNALEYYDGAAWVGAPVGDITSVTAGTGISGGGSSGAVTITNSMATEIAAKGDLIVGTGSATFDNLTAGTNNAFLKADSTAATGLKWDYDAWTSYTPTIAPVSGSFTTASATGRYKQIGKTVFVQVTGTITVVGTGSGVTITAPFTAANLGTDYTGAGRNGQTGDGLQTYIQQNSNLIRVFNYNNTNAAASLNVLICALTYEI